jgi:hypothetical protein
MTSIKGFNPARLILLIRNDLFINRNFFLVSLAAVAGLLLILSSAIITSTKFSYQNYYLWGLVVMGLNMTERTFRDLHDDVKGPAWLTLPASMLEKFFSRALLLTVVFPIGLIIFFFLISIVSESMNRLLIGSSHTIFNPFSKGTLLTTYTYFIIQSLFMLGAIYFKKSPSVKTILTIIAYTLAFVIIVAITLKIFFGEAFPFIIPVMNGPEWAVKSDMFLKTWQVLKSSAHIASWYILAPACWVIGYIRLKEKEV